MTEKITRDMITSGYEKGWIKLVTDQTEYASNNIDVINLHLDTGEIMCHIGEHSFYFAGFEGETCTANEYIKNTPNEDILDEIYCILEGIKNSPDYGCDYLYYYYYLKEHLEETNAIQ